MSTPSRIFRKFEKGIFSVILKFSVALHSYLVEILEAHLSIYVCLHCYGNRTMTCRSSQI